MTLQEQLQAKREEMIRRETERQTAAPQETPKEKVRDDVDENGDPIPTGEFEYKLWCNRRKADGLPVLPKPGTANLSSALQGSPKRTIASTVVPTGKLEDLASAPKQ